MQAAEMQQAPEHAAKQAAEMQQAPEHAAKQAAEINITGPHGYIVGDRVRVHGLEKKPEYNGTLGTVDRLQDIFGMGRIAVKFDSGKDLSLKASNVERACSFCSAVFGAQLQLCPRCEDVYLCEACKPQHMCEDNNGKVGISVDDQFIVMHVSAKSPAALAGIQVGDTIQSIDGVATSDDVVPRIIGPVGSNVTLTLLRRTQLQTPPTVFTVTIRRGREPRSAGPELPMPGFKVVGLVSQGPDGCVYSVETD